MKIQRLAFLLGGLVAIAVAPAFAKPACDDAAVSSATLAVEAACPCDAQADGTAWKNHGQYVSCVAHARKAAADEAGIKKSCLTRIVPCAANSNCGKSSKVTCVAPTGLCVFGPGACSSDIQDACDTAADCANPEDTCKAVGSCSLTLTTSCFDDAGCPAEETCVFSGTCDNDPLVICSANADCGADTCFATSAETCAASNGTAGSGSCCDLDADD